MAAETETLRDRPLTPGWDMVRRFRLELGVVTLLLATVAVCRGADGGAMISGVVRDARGVPQMGAVVEILSTGAVVRATAYTDLKGRYAVARVVPGRYGVRASAALLLPAVRSNLLVQAGHRSVVDLTLSALFDETSWLPAHARSREELSDDWSWTLRSSAGRPILKLAGDGGLPGAWAARLQGRVPWRMCAGERAHRRGGLGRVRCGPRWRVSGCGRTGSGLEVEVAASPRAPRSGDGAGSGSTSELAVRYERPMGVSGVMGGRGERGIAPGDS